MVIGMSNIHNLCIRHIHLNEGINLESAKFKYKRMRSGRRLVLQRKVRELYQRGE